MYVQHVYRLKALPRSTDMLQTSNNHQQIKHAHNDKNGVTFCYTKITRVTTANLPHLFSGIKLQLKRWLRTNFFNSYSLEVAKGSLLLSLLLLLLLLLLFFIVVFCAQLKDGTTE